MIGDTPFILNNHRLNSALDNVVRASTLFTSHPRFAKHLLKWEGTVESTNDLEMDLEASSSPSSEKEDEAINPWRKIRTICGQGHGGCATLFSPTSPKCGMSTLQCEISPHESWNVNILKVQDLVMIQDISESCNRFTTTAARELTP
ncbi:hypothetical protein KIN20_009559 [Parelaphostrongylus tenuis]|uniref:Uncharacterized protein n=1 Tax=Parelaphostrongylus tenuis TaxID=148309 RepID=A0AAD5QKQ2_PARTN|nr:hypothetical protein KIN20_009559 [Parelaphostrongylus tenuis]